MSAQPFSAAAPAASFSIDAGCAGAASSDARLDALMRLAERHFDVAAACVMPGEPDWRARNVWLDASLREVLRDLSDAGSAVCPSEPLIITDTDADPLWQACLSDTRVLPFRFVAVWPLHGSFGERIGSFCLIDYEPRTLDDTERASLDDFARVASALISHSNGAARHQVELEANEVPGLVFQCRLLPNGQVSLPYASAGIAEIFELTPDAVARDASCIDALIHRDDLARWRASFAESAAHLTAWHVEFRVQLRKQGLRWRQCDAKPQRLANGVTVWHGFVTDITERKCFEAQLQEFATTDALTQLSNRRHFMVRLEAQLAQLHCAGGPPAALLMCDLDHFKSINDRWGHAVGDHALHHFARIVRSQLRVSDVAGRIGGEEFAILLGAVDIDGAITVARRIQQTIAREPVAAINARIALTVSIGITALSAADANIDSALSRSDLALYRAKRNGRNRIECA